MSLRLLNSTALVAALITITLMSARPFQSEAALLPQGVNRGTSQNERKLVRSKWRGEPVQGAFLIWSSGSHAFAQDKKQSGVATTQATTETERPKTDVDREIEKARERGETVLGTCLQDCDEKDAVEGDLETGRALVLPKPAYPKLARAARASGEVIVQLLIDVDGTVLNAAVVSGHPLLYAVSLEAAKNSRFSPTKLDGKPVKVTGVLTYNFVSQ